MPMRVKCRCGHEVVAKYGEWVYALAALLALSAMLNTALVLYIFVDRSADDGRIAREEAVAVGYEPGSLRDSSAPSVPASGKPTPSSRPSAGGEAETPRVDEEPEEPEEPAPTPRDAGGPDAGGPDAERGPRPLVILNAAPPSAPALPAGQDTAPRPAPSPTGPTSGSRRLVEVGPLVRLLLLESSAERFEGLPDLAFALLLDPDALLRRRALVRLRSSENPPGARFRESVDELLREAFVVFKADGASAELEAFCAQRFPDVLGRAPDAAGTAFDELWNAWQERAQKFLAEDEPGLGKRLEALRSRGLELAFLIDTSESMALPLRMVRSELEWLLPALDWGLPGVRGGAVLYADGVRAVERLERGLAEPLLRLLERTEIGGGGDVPEDLHVAAREALSLGRIDWRAGTEKHLLVIGDAPPPYREVKRLLLLLEQAHEEGGFLLHTFGVAPHEGREEVPFFGALAAATEGCSVTRPEGEIGRDLLECLLGQEEGTAASALVAALEELFRSAPLSGPAERSSG